MQKKIVVFAGNGCRKDREEYYYNLAYKTGKLLAKEGFIVVTGGGPGLMNEVCRGAIESKGETIGICLDVAGRVQSSYLTHKEMFNHLNKRQERLLELGDGFIALPGGVGTFYEIIAILALKRKNEIPSNKPLILVDDYFEEYKILIDKMTKEGFAENSIKSYFEMVSTIKKAIKRLRNTFSPSLPM
jgi:uncharacterized protein (TIGR00730 family)